MCVSVSVMHLESGGAYQAKHGISKRDPWTPYLRSRSNGPHEWNQNQNQNQNPEPEPESEARQGQICPRVTLLETTQICFSYPQNAIPPWKCLVHPIGNPTISNSMLSIGTQISTSHEPCTSSAGRFMPAESITLGITTGRINLLWPIPSVSARRKGRYLPRVGAE